MSERKPEGCGCESYPHTCHSKPSQPARERSPQPDTDVVEEFLAELDGWEKKTDYEAWRPALIAFLEHDSPWMAMTLNDLRKGFPLTNDNRRMIEALILAGERVAA